MAWDRDRPVPWKRLFTFVAIYSLVVFGLFALFKPSEILQSIPGLAFGAFAALAIMALLTKFGWQPTMLKSRADIATARAEREAAKSGTARTTPTSKGSAPASAAADAQRTRPAPTKRTTPGRTNNPRRTRDTRKR